MIIQDQLKTVPVSGVVLPLQNCLLLLGWTYEQTPAYMTTRTVWLLGFSGPVNAKDMLLFYSFYSKTHLFCQSFSLAKENEIAYVQDAVVKASPRLEVACGGPAAIAQPPYSKVEMAATAAVWREEGKDVPSSDSCHQRSSPVPSQLLMAIASATLRGFGRVLMITFSVSKGLRSVNLTFENIDQL